jgi:hypothetical protein
MPMQDRRLDRSRECLTVVPCDATVYGESQPQNLLWNYENLHLMIT